MPVTNRKLFGAATLALIGLGALVGFLSVTDFSDTPALGRKEREAKKNQTESIDRKHDDDSEDGITDGHDEQRNDAERAQDMVAMLSRKDRDIKKNRTQLMERKGEDDSMDRMSDRQSDMVMTAGMHPNEYCVGHMKDNMMNPKKDGQGYICSKALLKPHCETHEELSSLYCACCHCYRQCNLKETEHIGCQARFEC